MDVNGQSLESTASKDITENINQFSRGNVQSTADSYSGNSAGRGILNAQTNFDRGLGGENTAEAAAIRNRYMPQYDRHERQLNLDNVRAAGADRIRNLAVATQAASEEVQLNRQKAILKDKIEKAQRAARGAVLGHVLGIVGGVVGGVVTGGVGAAAGFAAGEAAGNAIGGS
jgi:hypothetical protein